MVQQKAAPARWFWRLALITVLLTWGLIVVGGVVRVTESGLGCGNDWPLCKGSLIPPLDDLNAWIEWSHRLLAISIGIFGLGMLIVAVRSYRREHRSVLVMTVIGALLYAGQSDLGRSVVKNELSPALVAFHLGMAMLLLGALLSAAVFARYQPTGRYSRDNVTTLTFINTVLAFVIILTGALVRGSGASLACVDWPLCNGQVLPFSQGQLATVNVLHRFAVLALGITLALLVWQVWRSRTNQTAHWLAGCAMLAYLTQAAVGALFVFSGASSAWGALHVGLAAATWGLLVALGIVEWSNIRTISQHLSQQSAATTG
jgi:heme A synthase